MGAQATSATVRSLVALVSLMPTTAAAETKRPVVWGIMGTGAIAADFTRGLMQLPDAEVAAVGSRSAERATEFAVSMGIDSGVTTLHATYDELVEWAEKPETQQARAPATPPRPPRPLPSSCRPDPLRAPRRGPAASRRRPR